MDTVYRASDGKIFEKETDCLIYEEQNMLFNIKGYDFKGNEIFGDIEQMVENSACLVIGSLDVIKYMKHNITDMPTPNDIGVWYWDEILDTSGVWVYLDDYKMLLQDEIDILKNQLDSIEKIAHSILY